MGYETQAEFLRVNFKTFRYVPGSSPGNLIPGAYRIGLGKPPSFCLSQQKEPFTWSLCFLSRVYRRD